MRRLALFLVSLVSVSLGGSTCSNGDCPCTPCGSAINLTVVDDQNVASTADWTVEATLDGTSIDDVSACDPTLRLGNSCSFGRDTGLYRITVRAPGVQTRQIAARFAAPSGIDCCTGGPCLQSTKVTAVLVPE